jgi:hypothetical protein
MTMSKTKDEIFYFLKDFYWLISDALHW